MDAERFARLRALFESVADLAPSARAEALRRHGADADLVAEVLQLCAAGDGDRTQALSRVRDALLPASLTPPPEAGDRFGAWRIVDEIGRGGMGRVYRVERSDGSYRQTAALKFVKGVAGEVAVAHFARERQLLASLAHPNIARLLDGGTTTRGQPYLVMEFVDGLPIDAFCRDRKLGRDAILDLFARTCAAVGHAHRQLVVHCDLKPSNILVDAQGQPMLLDFGIAQLADRLSDEDSAVPGASPGYTPGYASPEQCRGERVGVDSDVYSLGVVLGEMLGTAGIEPDRELAAIVAMATREDRAARYASVDALCGDLARSRTYRPVHALPATPFYRASRFVRRRWAALLVTAVIASLTTGFTLMVMREGRRAQAAERAAIDERDRARRAELDARASETSARETTAFLTSVFEDAHLDTGSGTVSIATLLDQALLRVERDLAERPATQAQMSATLANVLFMIGQYDRGRALYARAIALERTQDRPLVLAKMLTDNAGTYLKYLRGDPPYDDVREALRLLEGNAGPESPLRLELSVAAAGILEDVDAGESTRLYTQSLDMARQQKPDSLALAETLANFGWHERQQRRYDHAVTLMREALALRLKHQGETHEDYVSQLEALAFTLTQALRFDEADPLFRQALDLRRRYGRLDGAQGAWSLAQYAMMLGDSGRALEALPIYDEIFAIARRKLPGDDDSIAMWTQQRANVAEAAGDLAQAERWIGEAVARAKRKWGPRDALTATYLVRQGRILNWRGCEAEGGAALQDALAVLADQRPSDDMELNEARVQRARWLTSCGRVDTAQELLREAASHRADLPPMLALRLAQAEAQLRLQRDGDADALQAVQDAEALAARTYAPHDARIALARLPRAEWLRVHGRRDEAAQLAAGILADVDGKLLTESPLFARIRRLHRSGSDSGHEP
ncbi:serine/threonine-protein kinase [Dokdonella sp.]|uniref:serine/threonine-protein kinase n=1 Tax=Dokdonella sp. TaxID=2291710 RepID=UPI002612A4F5|nr:serine/threonine-protein kinase [Dokdonella sp.]